MDQIRIDRLKVFAHHGVYPEESQQGQNFYVSAILDVDTREAGLKDELSESVDYGSVCMFIDKYMKANTYKLLEAVAENLAREILLKYLPVQSITLKISKPQAPIPLPFDDVSVTVKRGWHEAYIGLGSNLGDRNDYIEQALEMLENENDIYMLRTSELIETKAYGGVATEDFINGVVKIRTLLNPYELLRVCHMIEREAKRERDVHWGNRTLDLDILFYDDLILSDEYLTIPHIDIKNRDFVLVPMAEIAPGFVHPVYRLTMKDMKENLCQTK
ncbi:MAG: 2-amino-4-hydroxy-6-hydroxymethyldihydropteridine diphosphokinase [Lachnospiraceae bacterium]|nr:2-amino-4-hydroxy-6-hydroxymethyldihydropteridine diphosphokinase [Lachnospiraceae bacterium]MDD5854530.1 2-amino-4-hydroxy-6-hydroxymethyldihydropteridine diphosphokinase [Lachnospiraceae bacterium]